MKAMILAGGLGTRLRPFTFSIPKPLLPVGEKPILQIIIERLKAGGIDEIVLATGYQAELIRTFCGDGSRFGVRASYLHEPKALGTAGPLSLARGLFQPDELFLLMNGDVVTGLDFGAFLASARANGCELTVGYTKHVYQSPFGVLAIEDGSVRGIVEKPVQEYSVSAGIYALRGSALAFVPDDSFFTMPELMLRLIAAQRKVSAYFVRDCWIGLESIEHFAEAIRELENLPAEGEPAGGDHIGRTS